MDHIKNILKISDVTSSMYLQIINYSTKKILKVKKLKEFFLDL